MAVMTAEALLAQAQAIKDNPLGGPPEPHPRPRRQQGQSANGASGSGVRDRMSYYIAGPQPVTKRPVKPIPRRAAVSPAPDAAETSYPEEYDEYALESVAKDSWKHSIMTFKPANKDATIELTHFQHPIKLNRKKPKSMLYAEPEPDKREVVRWVPQKGPDGNPVYHNGEMVMVDGEGNTSISAAKLKAFKAKGKAPASETPAKKKPSNKKKTRQVFKASAETRAKRHEEGTPWVLEDGRDNDWVARMSSVNDDGIYALMVPTLGGFEFIPVHRYYDFMPKKQVVANKRADEIHELFTSGKRPSDLISSGKMSGPTKRIQAKMAKMEIQDVKPLVKREPGEDGEYGGRRPKNEADGDLDEMDYEEGMQDDEEGNRHETMEADEEEKRTEERLKREFASANKVGNLTRDDDSDDDFDLSDMLNDDGKRLKKALLKAGDYEDDSDEDEDDDLDLNKKYGRKKEEPEDEMASLASGVQQQPQKGRKAPSPMASGTSSAAKPNAPTPVRGSTPIPGTPSKNRSSMPPNDFATSSTATPVQTQGQQKRAGSRAASPAAPSGSAIVALRATAAKRPSGQSRATSPVGSRAVSPLAGDRARAVSPPIPSVSPANAATTNAKKRKDAPVASPPPAEASGSASSSNPLPKKKKKHQPAEGSSGGADGGLPRVPMPADLLKFIHSKGGKVTTKQLANRFRTKESVEVKQKLVLLVKEYGQMKMGEDGVTQWVNIKPEHKR